MVGRDENCPKIERPVQKKGRCVATVATAIGRLKPSRESLETKLKCEQDHDAHSDCWHGVTPPYQSGEQEIDDPKSVSPNSQSPIRAVEQNESHDEVGDLGQWAVVQAALL